MKALSIFTICFFIGLKSLFGQNAPSVQMSTTQNNNTTYSWYYNGDNIYVPCNSNVELKPFVYSNNSLVNAILDNIIVPNGWLFTYTNQFPPIYSAIVTASSGQQGQMQFFSNSPNQSTSITLNAKVAPPTTFAATPNLYANQSATFQVNVGNQLPYSSLLWETTNGLRVNGGMSFSGGTSATISTTGFGGRVRVRAVNSCGGYGDQIDMAVGPPYISSKTVNGSAAQSTNYTGSSPTLNVYTENTANNCTWSIVSGSGFLSSNGFTCGANIYGSFLQVKAQTTNAFGNGESYTFYLIKSSYRMASPNPVKSGTAIRVEFDDKKAAEATVEGVVLYNEKQKAVWSLDKTEAQNHFKEKDYLDIETKGMVSGTYYLNLQIAGKKQVERLIIE